MPIELQDQASTSAARERFGSPTLHARIGYFIQTRFWPESIEPQDLGVRCNSEQKWGFTPWSNTFFDSNKKDSAEPGPVLFSSGIFF